MSMADWTPEQGPWAKYNKIWRWEVMAGFCLIHGYRNGAELGVAEGRFTLFMLAMLPQLKIRSVDLWAPQPDNQGPETWADWKHDKNYERLKTICERDYPGRVNLVRDWTHKAALDVADGSLDFVFVDADHSYEGCRDDIVNWTPKVRKGGIIAGHDIHMDGVKKAVEETGRYQEFSDHVWVRPIL